MSRLSFFKSGLITAFFCGLGTHPEERDILMIFSTSSPSTGKGSLNNVVGIGSERQVVGFADITNLESASRDVGVKWRWSSGTRRNCGVSNLLPNCDKIISTKMRG